MDPTGRGREPVRRGLPAPDRLDLAAAITRLPLDQRVVVVLHHLEDRPADEIGPGQSTEHGGDARLTFEPALPTLE